MQNYEEDTDSYDENDLHNSEEHWEDETLVDQANEGLDTSDSETDYKGDDEFGAEYGDLLDVDDSDFEEDGDSWLMNLDDVIGDRTGDDPLAGEQSDGSPSTLDGGWSEEQPKPSAVAKFMVPAGAVLLLAVAGFAGWRFMGLEERQATRVAAPKAQPTNVVSPTGPGAGSNRRRAVGETADRGTGSSLGAVASTDQTQGGAPQRTEREARAIARAKDDMLRGRREKGAREGRARERRRGELEAAANFEQVAKAGKAKSTSVPMGELNLEPSSEASQGWRSMLGMDQVSAADVIGLAAGLGAAGAVDSFGNQGSVEPPIWNQEGMSSEFDIADYEEQAASDPFAELLAESEPVIVTPTIAAEETVRRALPFGLDQSIVRDWVPSVEEAVMEEKVPALQVVRAASWEDMSRIWRSPELPFEQINEEGMILTPVVGLVALTLDSGESMEGRLHAVGDGQVWVQTSLGRLGIAHSRVRKLGLLGGQAGDIVVESLERVRIVTATGQILGRILASDSLTTTVLTDEGTRITVSTDSVEPLGATGEVSLIHS